MFETSEDLSTLWDLYKRVSAFSNSQEVADISDKFNCKITVLLYLMMSFVLSILYTTVRPIVCYVANDAGGTNSIEYIEQNCWVQGCYAGRLFDRLPATIKEWETLKFQRITIHQWIPILLAVQGITFYLPHLLWKLLLYWNGRLIEITKVLENCQISCDSIEKSTLKDQLISKLEYYFFKENAFLSRSSYPFSKYMLIKSLYILNSVGNLQLIQYYLNINLFTNFSDLYGQFAHRNGSLLFPTVGICVNKFQQVADNNIVIAQCVLPLNIFIEKAYIIIFVWLIADICCIFLSMCVWLCHAVLNKPPYEGIKSYIKLHNKDEFSQQEGEMLIDFSTHLLKNDGALIIKLVSITIQDELLVGDIVNSLWNSYKYKYSGQLSETQSTLDLSSSNISLLNEHSEKYTEPPGKCTRIDHV